MYNCCQKHATSAVKQFPFILHWHVDMQGFTFLFLESSFLFHSNHWYPDALINQIKPTIKDDLTAGRFLQKPWLVAKIKLQRWPRFLVWWHGDMGGSNYPWPLGDDHLGTWPTEFFATCWTVCLDDWQWEGSLTCWDTALKPLTLCLHWLVWCTWHNMTGTLHWCWGWVLADLTGTAKAAGFCYVWWWEEMNPRLVDSVTSSRCF